jgi:hypothetical protein
MAAGSRYPRPTHSSPNASDGEIEMPFFETRDGTCLAYENYGSGPPIVFIRDAA